MATTTLSRRVYPMRTNDSVRSRSVRRLTAALVVSGLTASSAGAATVHLIAGRVTKAVALPNGSTVAVPMWGYALDANDNGLIDGAEVVTVPGPRIVVPAGDTSLTVRLTNRLTESTSLVIPGQPFAAGAAAPARVAGRASSMSPETAPNATHDYTFPDLKPGTFLYQSGSHQAVQVQMGLYGAMTQDAVAAVASSESGPGSPAEAYAGVPYAKEVVLVYSEVDPALHAAVDGGAYGPGKAVTSTVDYRPSLFLVNGASYTSESAATVAAGTAGQGTLLRLLNAGLRTHAPVLDGGSLRIVAEDGNPLPFAKDQAAVLLAAGKTHDALWTPGSNGVYSLYDRALGLNAPGQGSAGMLAKLSVASASSPDETEPIAVDDVYAATEDQAAALTGNVLGNDTNAATAALVAFPRSGLLTLLANGSFQYTPNPNFSGIDEFSYEAVSASSVRSAPALVTITVAPASDAPVALAQSVGVDKGASVSVQLAATDADGDSLSYYIDVQPGHGSLSYVDPVSKVQTPLTSTATAIPGGVVIYTPQASYPASATPGSDTFTFHASGGLAPSSSNVATVTATVFPVATAASTLTTPVALSVFGNDGSPIAKYRWTLEEDLTYKVVPGVADPGTLAVSFHRSYMPVVAAGTEADPVKVDPAKRYFVSVLPTEGTYSNGGAGIEAAQGAVTVTCSKLPLPTARIRVRVFQDNAPLNGVWDTGEPGLAGFQVTIDDAGGTYGMSGGHQSTDAFGNKLGTTYKACSTGPGTCESYEVDSAGDGFVLTDADGYALIENLVMGKYTVKVRAPGGQQWIQTSTIEGTPGIDAWVKPNEPQYFAEFGPPGPHVEVGFTRLTNVLPTTGGYTVSGRVTNLRQSRPPEVAQFSGAPFDSRTHTRTWVALNTGATGGSLLYAQPTNPDGTFSIAHVPNGSYQLVVFDKALDIIIGTAVVNVSSAPQNVGDVAVFSWFTNLYAFVFDDANGNGRRDAGEAGMPDQALNIRFRDGSIYQSLTTGESGFKAFNEVFPFFAWMVAEVDYARYHSTGLTVAVDAGGDARAGASNAYDWQAQMGLPSGLIPPETLNPQLQPENGNKPFRTESGAETPFLLLEGFQGFIGQSTVMMWGKAPYAPPGSIPGDVNVAPFDVFDPSRVNADGSHDVDGNGDGVFNSDQFNGGIAGIVHYAITRAENDPRWAAAENWEPGVSDVRVQLWDENRTHLLNEVTTDNWNNSLPEGCVWPNNQPYVYQGQATDCFDGLRNFNQARPALFDGGYAFSTILQRAGAAVGHEYDAAVRRCTTAGEVNCRDKEIPIPAGRYVVKIIVPPGYKLQKEEDKNVDFGDTYVPQQFWLTGYPLADAGGAGDAQPAPTVQDNALIAPFCVGQMHVVPDTLSLFPGAQSGTYGGESRPLCDAKLVTLRDGQQAAPDFHLFTEAPVAGHVYGMVLDDTTNEFDPNAPTFGEKYAVPFIGIAIKDWQGREITRTYSDQYGMYNALVPSTYTANPPEPSGVSPSILSACINPPTMPGPGGTVVPDPHFQKQYSHFCYPLQYLPGKTTYLDTPVVPTGAFTGNGTLPVDAELPNGTPVVAQVDGPGAGGPYVVADPDAASRTIVIKSAGTVQVPNPAWDGTGAQPKLVARDYGFGAAAGSVFVGATPLVVSSWTNDSITAVVPVAARTGQLSVVKSNGRRSVLGVTLSVATPQMNASRPPTVVSAGGSIQAAIDAARPGDLILVKPGVYEEMVIMSKPVRLQGSGALTTAINVVTTPSEQIQAWLDRMGRLLLGSPAAGTNGSYLLPNQPALAAPATGTVLQTGDIAGVVGDEGPGVMVLSRNLPTQTVLGVPGVCLGSFSAPANDSYCLHNEADTTPAPVTILSVTRGALNSGGTGSRRVTVVTAGPHGFAVGNTVTIAGVSPAAYAGNKTVTTAATPTQFTYNVPNGTPNRLLGAAPTAQLVVSQLPVWRPNARIDGLSLIGASNAPGVLVNGYAHYLEVSNTKIYTNSGTYAGGIQIGHPGAAAPFADEDAQNDHVSIHNNVVSSNAATETGGGGAIVLGTGSTNYTVRNNFVAANLTSGNGGGIAHIGRSEVGVIDGNTVVWNESFVQGTGTNGGGIFVGGTAQPAGAASLGTGQVEVTNNLVQGNAASGGDGGGIALDGFVGTDRVRLYNNVIVNNVAGLAGGGISIANVPSSAGGFGGPIVDIAHDTVADNDSTGTAGAAFSSPLVSTPQPAGISGRGSVSQVRIANSIVWHNRTFYFGPCTPSSPGTRCGIVPVSPTPTTTQYAELQITARPYWDLANLSGAQVSPVSTVLSALTGPSSSANYLSGTNNVNYSSNGNSSLPPAFVASYFNASRQKAYVPGETTGEATLISVPAALDEGGNFIRPQYGPLTLDNPATGQRFGDYHVTAGLPGSSLCGGGGLYTGACPGAVPIALLTDLDAEGRPTATPHRGADQAAATVVAPTLTAISPSSGVRGVSGLPVTLTGTNLAGTSSVDVTGAGVTCAVVSSTATSVAASCSISATAGTGARSVTVTAPGGASNGVTFTVTAPPPPILLLINPVSSTLAQRGRSIPVTLTGLNLAGATQLTISGSGVSVSSFTVNSSTSISAIFAIGGTPAGAGILNAHQVKVVTPDGTSNALPFIKF